MFSQIMTLWVDGKQRELAIFVDRKVIKKLPVKGLQNRLMNFPEYLELICQEAISSWRRFLRGTPPIAGLRCESTQILRQIEQPKGNNVFANNKDLVEFL